MGSDVCPFRISPLHSYKPTILHVGGNVEGTMTTQPKGILAHGTRSGNSSNTESQEFYGTLNFIRNGAAGLGWHATIGPNLLSIHMSAEQWAYNAREHSDKWIALEFAQPVLGAEISDASIKAGAYYIKHYALRSWPTLPMTIIHHSELPAGIRDGKTDIFARQDTQGIITFNNRLLQAIKEV